MIILIGGAGSVGKTAAAQKLLEIHKIPYLSMDHLKMGLIRGLKNVPIKATDSDEKTTEFLWPILKEIILTNIENNQNLIIEGCYLPFDFERDFSERYKRFIISFFIVVSESYAKNNFGAVLKNRNVIETRKCPEERTAEQFVRENDLIKRNCVKNNLNYFEIRTNYQNDMEEAYSWVGKKVEEYLNFINGDR